MTVTKNDFQITFSAVCSQYKHWTYQHSMLANTGAKLETWSWAWPCSAPRDLLKQFYINFVLIAGHKFYDITRIIFSRAPFVSLGNLQTDPLTQNLLDILSSPLLPMLGRKVLNVWESKILLLWKDITNSRLSILKGFQYQIVYFTNIAYWETRIEISHNFDSLALEN